MPTTAATEPAPLALDDVSFAIGGRAILSGVTLAVRPREIVCLLGPSGCGKTTLLRIAAGIERQDRGTVAVGGTVVAAGATFVPAEKRRIGFVFQDLALFPHMRVGENVAFGVGAGAADRAREALAQVGLADAERRWPHELSGGQQQRVALARALLPAPSVVLLDEPFSSLDRSLRDAVRQDVVSLIRARGATGVVVTHDAEEALSIADRIALMRDGRIVQLATPEEIWRWPIDLAAARVFSAVNAFHARAAGGCAETPVGRVPVAADLDGAAITIAFRPEALRVFPADRPGGVEAVVTHRRFFGGAVELGAAVGEARLVLRADPYLVPHAPTVKVVPDVRQAIVLRGTQ